MKLFTSYRGYSNKVIYTGKTRTHSHTYDVWELVNLSSRIFLLRFLFLFSNASDLFTYAVSKHNFKLFYVFFSHVLRMFSHVWSAIFNLGRNFWAQLLQLRNFISFQHHSNELHFNHRRCIVFLLIFLTTCWRSSVTYNNKKIYLLLVDSWRNQRIIYLYEVGYC